MTGHTDMQFDIQHAEAIAGTATKATLGGASGANSSTAGGATRIGGAGGPGVVIVEW